MVAVFAATVMWYGFEIFFDSFVRGRTTGSLLNIPIWIVELAVPVGFALLLIQSIIEIIKLLSSSSERPDTEDQESDLHSSRSDGAVS